MSDVFLTGKTEGNVLQYAIQLNGALSRGKVPAPNELEAQVNAVYAALKWAVGKGEKELTLHTDMEQALGYLTGKYKALGDTSKKFVHAVQKLKKENRAEFSYSAEMPEGKAEKLYQAAFGQKQQEASVQPPAPAAPIEKPLEKPKAQPKKSAWSGFKPSQHAMGRELPNWSLKVFDNSGECIINLSSRDFKGSKEHLEAVQKDAAYMADWNEQVCGYRVERVGLLKGANDFSNYKGFSGTAVDVGKELMTVWKNGDIIYSGAVTEQYKREYIRHERHPKWEEEIRQIDAARIAAEQEQEENEYHDAKQGTLDMI